ncbi:hypothetical protein [Tahibacter amnicola]|uniref:Uncharacterized protein n=1 Tax=Tahibacter amnicola TaxID=2976241 RepID=A0ABY6B843_9GAMM|nr:hypothetical protein [Tahibacter amnicola]UXI66184.1 hypothetical protein N4264_15655 [Tahibacter amnicola]
MNAADHRAALRVARLDYRILPTPLRSATDSADDTVQRFATAIGKAAKPLLDMAPVDDYVLGSTLNSPLLSDPESLRESFRAVIAEHSGRLPQLSVNVYECINWALLLRNALIKARHEDRPRRLLMQIADADMHGIRATWQTRTYGNARFGIATVLVDVDPRGDDGPIEIGCAPVDRSMMKFGGVLRQAYQRAGDATLAVPFFPEPTRGAFRKMIPNLRAVPDRHDSYGHCFGCDPWIALGHDHAERGGEIHYVLGSLALNGYYAVGRVTVGAGTVCTVDMAA